MRLLTTIVATVWIIAVIAAWYLIGESVLDTYGADTAKDWLIFGGIVSLIIGYLPFRIYRNLGEKESEIESAETVR